MQVVTVKARPKTVFGIILAVTGIDMLITEIFSGIAAVLVQFIWWFHTLMTLPLVSKISLFQIVIRHNTAMERQAFMSQWDMFLQNRCFFTAVGIVCALLTVLVYKYKREGKFHGLRVLDKLFARKHRA
jgi:divalent metal cation (Fe/Co/Zn/Cd) transporter